MNLSNYGSTHYRTYAELAEVVRSILERAAAQVEDAPRPQAVQCRAKSVMSLTAKLRDRELLSSETIEHEIKDLAGVRLIFYTNTDVDRFLNTRIIPDTFDVQWEETRVHHPTDENDHRRYQAIHYTVALGSRRTDLAEYAKFAGMRCEIQIQTVLNHAWSETQHDMVYKARLSGGYGARALGLIEQRMEKVMDDYLRPAGHEFQKVQHDFERLMQGKALFERGVVEALRHSVNNNERYETLETIAESVLPHYDDIASVYPDLCQAFVDAITAARCAAKVPIKTPFGDLRGQTARNITSLTVRTLDRYRYVNVVTTFRSLTAIFADEPDADIRKEILHVVERLARYHLAVWKQAGPGIQAELARVAGAIPDGERPKLRPVLRVLWRELLGSNVVSLTTSADAMTFGRAALPVDEHVKAIRAKAIEQLIALLGTEGSVVERIQVIEALREATRVPSQAGYSNELLALTLANTKEVLDLLAERIAGQSYQFLARLEHDMLFDYRRARDIAKADNDRFGCADQARLLAESILALRDTLNADTKFVRYKTLVGFNSVFDDQWHGPSFNYNASQEHRRQKIAEYVDAISEDTADEWFDLIQQCAATESNDLATFPIFREFLVRLASAKPGIALRFLAAGDPGLMSFMPAFLNGLSRSDAQPEYTALVIGYLDRGLHLIAIAKHCRSSKQIAEAFAPRVLEAAIAANEPIAVIECLVLAIEQHEPPDRSLVDPIFLPALNYLTARRDARWVRGAGFLPEAEPFFVHLSEEDAGSVLQNLLALPKIGHEGERILVYIATSHPAAVWDLFQRRLGFEPAADEEDEGEHGERYEAIPYRLHDLPEVLARDAGLAVVSVRAWYEPRNSLFQFTGSRLLHAIFPAFTAPLGAALLPLLSDEAGNNYDFVISILRNYCGEPATHDLIKCLIDRLPETDSRLAEIEICLNNTGVVEGKFGFVDAFRAKKAEIDAWLADERPRVRQFAKAYMQRIDQRIASEQRSAEQRNELLKRRFDAGDV